MQYFSKYFNILKKKRTECVNKIYISRCGNKIFFYIPIAKIYYGWFDPIFFMRWYSCYIVDLAFIYRIIYFYSNPGHNII